jgi:phosphoglycolate phosphatase
LKTVIFDLDGTVLHSAPGIIQSLTHAIRQLGHTFDPHAGIEQALSDLPAEGYAACRHFQAHH